MQPSMRARHDSPDARPDSEATPGKPAGKAGWLPTLVGRFGSKQPEKAAKAEKPEADPLLAFPSETVAPAAPQVQRDKPMALAPKPPAATKARKKSVSRGVIAAGVVTVVAVPSLGVLTMRGFAIPQFGAAPPRTGTLTIDSRPAGSQVLIDGVSHGATPLKLALQPGAHTITIKSDGDERVVPLTIAAGADVTQYFELKTSAPAAIVGGLSIATDPPGARVSVDGKPRGVSPITVGDLAAEPHKITVTNDAGSVERTIAVAAGSTTSLMFALPKSAGPVGGWLSIASPFDVEVLENKDLIGASGATRIMLAAGRHDLVLSNTTLGYQEARRVEVAPGQTTSVRVDAPKASVSVNARPWAEIIVDGANVGQTPIANVQIAVGTHEMLFRHPQLGERRQTIVVTAKGPNRIAVDLTR